MPALPDALDRELITTALDETLFVEAGAGTGKTTALVGRIVGLIRSGVRVESLAAITFTEKAAAELAERVRKELERAARGEKEFARLSHEERQRCEIAVKELDSAALQTLHSFARKILALYPLEANLPPEVQVLDDVEGVIDFREHWRAFVEELFSERSPIREQLLLGLTLGLRMKDLERLAARFHENWDRLRDAEFETADIPDVRIEPVLAPFAEALDRRSECYNPQDKLLMHLEWLASLREGMEAARDADPLTKARLLSGFPEVSRAAGRYGQKGNWRNAVEDIRQLLKDTDEAVNEQLSAARRAVLCALLPLVRDFVLEYAAERRSQGRIGFQDMLVFAVDLLRAQPDVRLALHQRYRRILIDEFQDTDPLQVELAALLAGNPSGELSTWDQTPVEAGRLFFVGDPKQSIYRFRRADIGLFNKTRTAFGSRHIQLITNFRSSPEILDWVNSVFGRLFQHDEGIQQAPWVGLQPKPPEGKVKSPRVRVLGGPIDGRADEVRRAEADELARAILAARADFRLGEMAILLPTRTNAPAIERALSDAGIPFRVESRSRTFATQDLRDLLNILSTIDDPTDEVALVASLRSATFACSDPDLLTHVQSGGRWDYTAAIPEGTAESVRTAFAELKMFHERRWHLGIGALVEEVIVRRHLMELALASLRPRETWRRLRFIAEQARSLEGSGVLTTLRQFVEWMRVQVEERAMVNEGAVVEPDDDAIRIMTIHAAKGLEFDAVFVGGLGILPIENRNEVVIWPERAEDDHRVEAHLGTNDAGHFQTAGYDEAKKREAHHSRLERDRLLYVAATRARKLLVVSLFHIQKKDHETRHLNEQCASAECISWACQEGDAPGLWEQYTPPMALYAPESDGPPPADSREIRDAWIAAREHLLEQHGAAPVFAATTLAHAEDEEDEDPAGERERQPWRKGRAGTSIGRAVHAVLQTIDLATGAGIEDAARSQAVAEGIADRAKEIVELVQSARRSDAVQSALASGRYWREVYVGTRLGDGLVEGFIDLLYERPDGYVIVDYKTDTLPDDAAIERAMARYEIQGAVYALALEQALGKPVADVVFVFTEPQRERRVGNLDAAKGRSLDRLREKLAVRV